MKKTYKVKSNLKHDGILYIRGKKIELEEDVATKLLNDNIIVEIDNDVEEDEKISPQPAVNNVTRKGEETDGEFEVEPGKVTKPQPGDEVDKEDEPEKSEYKILKGLEYPKGTVHNIDDVIELTDEQAGKFAEGLIEKTETKDDEDNL